MTPYKDMSVRRRIKYINLCKLTKNVYFFCNNSFLTKGVGGIIKRNEAVFLYKKRDGSPGGNSGNIDGRSGVMKDAAAESKYVLSSGAAHRMLG